MSIKIKPNPKDFQKYKNLINLLNEKFKQFWILNLDFTKRPCFRAIFLSDGRWVIAVESHLIWENKLFKKVSEVYQKTKSVEFKGLYEPIVFARKQFELKTNVKQKSKVYWDIEDAENSFLAFIDYSSNKHLGIEYHSKKWDIEPKKILKMRQIWK